MQGVSLCADEEFVVDGLRREVVRLATMYGAEPFLLVHLPIGEGVRVEERRGRGTAVLLEARLNDPTTGRARIYFDRVGPTAYEEEYDIERGGLCGLIGKLASSVEMMYAQRQAPAG